MSKNQEKLSALEAAVRRQELDDIKKLLDTDMGRRLLWRLFEYANIYGEMWTQNENRVHFNLGKRDVGIWMMNEMETAKPGAVLTMMHENALRQARLEADKENE